jgi:two-component system OmpR family response regulator
LAKPLHVYHIQDWRVADGLYVQLDGTCKAKINRRCPARSVNPGAPMRILMVEDEPEMARVIINRLVQSGFKADRACSLADARNALETNRYSFALIDRRLPDGDGISLLPDIRRTQPGIRVLMLTVYATVDDKIEGLDAGADDYLAKPFDMNELMARIRAGLRRFGDESTPPVVIGALSFNCDSWEVVIGGQSIVLHRRELALLGALVQRAGRVVSRDKLTEQIFGFEDEIPDNALNILVSRLRRRLSDLNAGVKIHSARGIGYMLTGSAT